MPMHEVVFSYLRSMLFEGRRRPSFAGNGLPERMRSTAFAFLGLTAAAGLALVAIFAQVSLPLLSPAPPPGGPSKGGSVAEAVALSRDRGVRLPSLAAGSIVPLAVKGKGRSGGQGAHGDERVGSVGSPLAVATPPAGGGGVDGGSTETQPPAATPTVPPAPSGAATTTPPPTPAPDSDEAPDPKPTEKPAKLEPAKTTAKTKPGKSKPAKSESKDPEVEATAPSDDSKADSKANKPEAKPPEVEADPGPPYKSPPPPAPESPAEKPNGKALGHNK
jgi:hypothetical protein